MENVNMAEEIEETKKTKNEQPDSIFANVVQRVSIHATRRLAEWKKKKSWLDYCYSSALSRVRVEFQKSVGLQNNQLLELLSSDAEFWFWSSGKPCRIWICCSCTPNNKQTWRYLTRWRICVLNKKPVNRKGSVHLLLVDVKFDKKKKNGNPVAMTQKSKSIKLS